MRHGDKIKNLGRTASHRAALLSNMTCQLIEHKRIVTTLAKAKSLRVYAEPLITRSKTDSTHNRRMVFSYLQDKVAVTELFSVIGDKVANRPGGYTRIIKMPRRMGDAADMALIELVDFNELYMPKGEEQVKKTRRSRRGGGSGSATGTQKANTPVEATATAVPVTEAQMDTAMEHPETAPELGNEATGSTDANTADNNEAASRDEANTENKSAE